MGTQVCLAALALRAACRQAVSLRSALGFTFTAALLITIASSSLGKFKEKSGTMGSQTKQEQRRTQRPMGELRARLVGVAVASLHPFGAACGRLSRRLGSTG